MVSCGPPASLLAEVHFAQRDLPEELEAEWHLLTIDEIRLADISIFLHHEHVLLIKLRFAVIAFVV